VDRIGTALGAALIGSAVAVEKAPSDSHSPIPFFEPPGGKSGTIFVLAIFALLLVAAALILREVRHALGLGTPRAGLTVMDHEGKANRRPAAAWARVRVLPERGLRTARRLRMQAASGVRSLF